MKSNKTTIVFEKSGHEYKIFKLLYQTDGSYYVTAPYHKEDTAFLYKMEVDYRSTVQQISWNQAVEKMELEDENRCLKLSHHPTGFLQFSGSGVRSGLNPDGSPKGMGIQSWLHSKPPRGPAFGLSIKNIRSLKENTSIRSENLVIKDSEVVNGIDLNDLIISAHYIPIEFVPYIFIENEVEYFSITHPSGTNIKLYVVRPDNLQNCVGFLGLNIQMAKLQHGENESGFIFSTSGGNFEYQDGKIIKGVCMYAIYPNTFKDKFPMTSLNWK